MFTYAGCTAISRRKDLAKNLSSLAAAVESPSLESGGAESGRIAESRFGRFSKQRRRLPVALLISRLPREVKSRERALRSTPFFGLRLLRFSGRLSFDVSRNGVEHYIGLRYRVFSCERVHRRAQITDRSRAKIANR